MTDGATSLLHSMYGPPPDCKRFEVGRKDSLRKCIRPLSGEWLLRALDDYPHVPVLLNPSVTRDAFEGPGFPARRWTVLSSSSLLSRPLELKPRRRGGGKVESVPCFPSTASFPTAIKRPPTAAAGVDTLGRWTTQPRPCEPACSRSRPQLCCAEHAEPTDAPTTDR